MLKHIVEVNVDSQARSVFPMVVVEYTITDGKRASHAQVEVVPDRGFQVVRDPRTCRFMVRITDQGYYMAICKDLKRKATDHFHGEVVTEIRMNER